MLFVVKKDDGLQVVVLSHIEVCNVATIASDPNRRIVTDDCFDHLTIDQAKVMVKRLGSSITGKDIRDVLEMHWPRIQQRAMSITRFFIQPQKGKGYAIIFLNDHGFHADIFHSGMSFTLQQLQDLMPQDLTPAMLKTWTKEDLSEFITDNDGPLTKNKYTKDALIEKAMEVFEQMKDRHTQAVAQAQIVNNDSDDDDTDQDSVGKGEMVELYVNFVFSCYCHDAFIEEVKSSFDLSDFNITVTKTDLYGMTIGSLKEDITDQRVIEKFDLFFDDMKLPLDNTLADHGLHLRDDIVLEAVITAPRTINIKIMKTSDDTAPLMFCCDPERTTIKDIKNFVENVTEMTNFDITEGAGVNAKIMEDYRRLAEFSTSDDFVVGIHLKLAGGAPKVKKHIMKGTPITDNNKAVVEQAFNMSKLITASSTFDIDGALKEASVAELTTMRDFFGKSTQTNTSKIAKFHELFPAYKQLEATKEMMEVACDKFKELLMADLKQKCSNSAGSVAIDKLREKVSIALGVKEATSSRDDAMM